MRVRKLHLEVLSSNMSKTYKDRNPKLRFPDSPEKKKKAHDSKHRWLDETPSWHTRMMMNRPERRSAHMFERTALSKETDDLDYPDTNKKPKIYYW